MAKTNEPAWLKDMPDWFKELWAEQGDLIADEPLWSQAQAAKYFGVHPRTTEGWRLRGGGPPFLTLCNRPRYIPAICRKWALLRLRMNTSSESAA